MDLDKLIQLCFRSIIREVSGNKDISEQYKQLAMEEYKEHEDSIKAIFENEKPNKYKNKNNNNKYIGKVEDVIPKQVKKKLYEMVS